MKPLFWVGMVLLGLGLVLLVIPVSRSATEGVSAGGMSMTVETRSSEKVSPIVCGVLILAGAGMLYAGRSAIRS